MVRHDLFCKYAKIIPYLPGLFVIVFLKVSSYYEQKGTLRMRKSEKKVSRYIKRAETSRDLLMKVVNFLHYGDTHCPLIQLFIFKQWQFPHNSAGAMFTTLWDKDLLVIWDKSIHCGYGILRWNSFPWQGFLRRDEENLWNFDRWDASRRTRGISRFCCLWKYFITYL